MEWVNAVDKRPCDRNVKDVDLIVNRLRRVEQLARSPNSLLQQLSLCGFYEDLEKGITIYRQGDIGKCWYVILNGVLEVRVIQSDGENKIPVTICQLGAGLTFGESIVHDLPRDFTVVTQTTCELLRIDQCDFRIIWEKNKEFMNDLVSSNKLKNGTLSKDNKTIRKGSVAKTQQSTDLTTPAKPITETPSQLMQKAGWVLRSILLTSSNTCLKDRKLSGKLVKRCAPGTELVEWLIHISSQVHSRNQATGMWQALLEEGIIAHVAHEQPFKDKCFLYRFHQDEEKAAPMPLSDDVLAAQEQLADVINILLTRGSDAILRMVLRKPSHERTADDLELIYEELLHIKALSHLSNSLKRELSSIIVFEAYSRAGTILFRQGDEGKSWYIILKGSVDVVIHGKGTVTTLHEGDDFGKLALINDAPRAATIVLKENNCHFLRVNKEHFNRILRDVEANTVRLKEHDQDVLILQNISAQQKKLYTNFKYKVMAGTPQKILEHLLETRLESNNNENANNLRRNNPDFFLDDFLLSHIIFMPTHQLVEELSRYFQIDSLNEQNDFHLTYKKRVVQFVYHWVTKIRHPVFDNVYSLGFIEELSNEIEAHCIQLNILHEEGNLMHNVMIQLQRYLDDKQLNEDQKWTLPSNGKPISLFSGNPECHTIIRPSDDIIFRVYCADHTYCTLRLPISSSVNIIKNIAADKLKMKTNDELLLVEVKSNGERQIFEDNDIGIVTTLGLNSRLFVSPKDHLDALTSLPEQEIATEGIEADLEMFSTKELAYFMTLFEWDLFWSVHEYELIYYTFGRHHFNEITANLDVFLRRFHEIQFWVVTEICLTTSMSKRISLLKKFIKLAAYCKGYQNLNAFCAIISGLSNSAVSRLSSTWDKVPPKFRKMFAEFEVVIDPGRNYRAYRDMVGKLQPPVVPFMPLLIKDMKFTHEGNRTCIDSLVNFEKMHLLAQTMRTVRYCRSRHLVLEPPSPKAESEIKSYISCLRAIDNQRILNNLSQKLESKKP